MIELKLSEFHYEDTTEFYTENSGYTYRVEKDGFTVQIGELWKPSVVKQLNLLDTELCREFNVSKIHTVYTRFGFRSDCYWKSRRELSLIKGRNAHILKRDQDEVYRGLVHGMDIEPVRRINQIIGYAVLEGFMPLEIAIPYAESIVVFGREDHILTAV